ncbi:MAG: sulfotransferase [Rhodospirillaceae bacterium]|nr:sulfotransferase [Rhodospirillaceae bacterium]
MTETRTAIRRARELLGDGYPDGACELLDDVLDKDPENSDARYTLAVAQRHRRRWSEALATLEQVLAKRPGYGRAHQEIGYNLLGSQNYAGASAAFERAVAADPSLLNSWKCLARLYGGRTDHARLKPVLDQIGFLEGLPPELLTVISYLSENRLDDAERLCRQFLRTHKTHVEGMRLLAEIATRNGVYGEAEFLLESCVEFEPQHRNARIQYANLLLRVQKFAPAYEQAEVLLHEQGHDLAVVRSLHAAACGGVGRSDAAIESYELLMQRSPGNHLFPVSLAHIHKANGDIDAAVALYRKAYRLKRDHGDAYWSLANAKSYRFTDEELERMTAVEADRATGADDRIHTCFALGKAYEDRREFARSFEYYARGNALRQAGSRHDPKHLKVRVDSQIEVCTAEFLAGRRGLGCDAPDPIFIVGLPRSGSTLLEQILSSHSQVDGTMELHNILNLAKRLRGRGGDRPGSPRYPRILAEIDDSYFRRFGEQYIEDTRAYRGAAPRFIDKMPNNFFHVGLIRLILPNARVVDARRHPMACCFSGFKQLFGEGQEFSYGLREIGNYYRQYVRLMDHWDRALPGFVLRVRYEDVVADLEGQVRRLLDFCGLPFEPACLAFHRTERSIRTPSAEQVRQPIYRSGLTQCRHYEPWLGPLKEALGEEVRERYVIEA